MIGDDVSVLNKDLVLKVSVKGCVKVEDKSVSLNVDNVELES